MSDTGRLDLAAARRTGWTRRITITDDGTPRNLTGWTAAAQMRDAPDDTLAADIVCTIVAPATGGVIDLSLTDTVTRDLPAGAYSWDLFLRPPGGMPSRLLAGTFSIVASTTVIP
jgi:hypothetical protein